MELRAALWALLLLAIWPAFLSGQYNQTETFTINDGLAMTECSGVYCDKVGRIWVKHSSGWLSMFDGRKFTRFSPDEIGVTEDGTQFLEDRRGLWVKTPNFISLYSHEKWNSWPLPQTGSIVLDRQTQEAIVVGYHAQLWRFNDTLNSWYVCAQIPKLYVKHDAQILYAREENLYRLTLIDRSAGWRPAKSYTSTSLLRPHWIEDAGFQKLDLRWQFHHNTDRTISIVDADYPVMLNKADVYEYLTTSQNQHIFVQSVPEVGGYRFVNTAYRLIRQDSFQLLARFMTGHRYISVVIDKMGYLWVGSHSGLLRVSTNIINCFEGMDHMVPSLHAINEDPSGRIWLAGYTSGLCYFEGNQLFPPPLEASIFKRFIPGSYRDRSGRMAFWTEDFELVVCDNDVWTFAKYYRENDDERRVGYYFLELENGIIAAGLQRYGLGFTTKPLHADTKWRTVGKEKGLLLNNVLTISEDKNNRLWVGRPSQGVAIYDPLADTARTWLTKPGTPMNFGMISSVIDPYGRLWMGCTDGLRVLENPASFKMFEDEILDKTIKVSMDEAGYSMVACLTVYDDLLVFGNQTGYGFMDLKSYANNPSKPQIFYYPTLKFGLSSEQNAILTDSKGFLWIGQDRGATRIDMRQAFLDSFPIQLLSKEVSIKSQDDSTAKFYFDATNQIRLPIKRRSITVHLEPSFTGYLMNNVGIRYRLLTPGSGDTLWSPYTRQFDIRLDYLPPGRNFLEVQAIKNNQIAHTTIYKLIVPHTLDESIWFWGGLFVSFSLLGFMFTRRIYRQRLQIKLAQVNLYAQQREKNQFQISAIANALNPHFIKNTLMWMQSRFRKDDEIVDVIDRLAYNISAVFAHSRKGEAFHTLGEEMQVVHNFLTIQTATYGPFFTMEWPEPDSWSAHENLMVPLLQLQIHIENAIEHGLRKKPEGPKNLSIRFQDETNYLVATIEDNGIGRKAAKQRGSRGTGQGTAMLDRVYELYNTVNPYPFSTMYEDMMDPITHQPLGTRVVIRIPKQYKIELQ